VGVTPGLGHLSDLADKSDVPVLIRPSLD